MRFVTNKMTEFLCVYPADSVECKPLEFTCRERPGCVPRFQVCDGEIDCTDGTDEMECGLFRSKRSPRIVLPLGLGMWHCLCVRVCVNCKKECYIIKSLSIDIWSFEQDIYKILIYWLLLDIVLFSTS